MSLVQTLLYHFPTPALGLLIVAFYVVFSVVGLCLVRSIWPAHKFKLHNDIADPLFTTMGAIYAVLLAFMVVTTWQGLDLSERNVAREANFLADLYRDSTPLPSAFRQELKTDLKDYVEAIISDEWPLMEKRGGRSQKVEAAQQKLWSLYGGFRPAGETEKIFFAEAVGKLNEASEMRRQRLLDAGSGLNGMLYFVLIAGGLVAISFTMFFGTENFGPQLLMTSMFATVISLTLFTIMAFDYPFTGDISIKPDVFRTVLVSLLNS
jgi:hypothetical protein